MAQIDKVDDHGLEVIRKSGFIPDDTFPTRYALRMGAGILSGVTFDYIAATYPTTTTETYKYYSGGVSGTLQATINLTYTDSTKEDISIVERV